MQLEQHPPSPRSRARRNLAHMLLTAALAADVGFSQTQVTPAGGPLGHSIFCPPSVKDVATGNCVGVSTIPTAGFLLPLGPELFVEPLDGRVGLGTTLPGVHLDVVGPGGTGSTIRTMTTTGGSGGLLLQRGGGTPADWALSFDLAPKRDFLIHDNVAQQTRLRILPTGQVECEALRVGNAAAGLRMAADSDSANFYFGAGGMSGSLVMAIGDQDTFINGSVHLQDLYLGYTNSITFDQITGPPQPMIHMFDGGTANADRMVLAHSPNFQNWGLRYDDVEDAFHFLGAGNGVLTIALSATQGKIGIENTNPSNILTIQQGSPTDPIADAWTVYSSRRWKENIEPLEHGLERVLALRAVTFDWKETGKPDLGMIAEEVGAILPELVEFEENGIDARSVDYARLSAVLVEAVKEQQAQLELQAERLRAQERDVQALLARVELLEASRAR